MKENKKLRRKVEERFGKGKEPWADKFEDSRAEIWNLCKLASSSYISIWGIQKSKGSSDDIYNIHFKRSLNSDFTKAKNYIFFLVDVAIKLKNCYLVICLGLLSKEIIVICAEICCSFLHLIDLFCYLKGPFQPSWIHDSMIIYFWNIETP